MQSPASPARQNESRCDAARRPSPQRAFPQSTPDRDDDDVNPDCRVNDLRKGMKTLIRPTLATGYALCTTCALGDERHYVFDCPRFAGLRLTHAELFQDASGAMKSLVWHKDQEDVCALLLAIVAQAQT